MHDSQAKTEARVRTALEMRLRPRWASREPVKCRYLLVGARWPCKTGSLARRAHRPGGAVGSAMVDDLVPDFRESTGRVGRVEG